MDYKKVEHQAKERFSTYVKNYDLTQPKIALKAKHTFKVAALCQRIAVSENLNEEDCFIAFMCGLLHDIGRFEQVTRFNTFYDSESVNHAYLSCEILWGTDSLAPEDRCPDSDPVEGMVREFIPTDEYDDLIRNAIWWHAAYRYPDNMSEREKKFCDILRDADKIDIFRVNLETPLSDIHNVPIEAFYTSEITPEVLDAFMEHHCILRTLKKTPVDNIVGYCSLYWELVFPESRAIVKEQGYLETLANFHSKNSKTDTVFSQIRRELGLE